MIAADNHQNEQENSSEGHISGFGVNNQYKKKGLQETTFQCPMNCEGNKRYNQPGECPVCNMQLVIVGIDEPKIHVE